MRQIAYEIAGLFYDRIISVISVISPNSGNWCMMVNCPPYRWGRGVFLKRGDIYVKLNGNLDFSINKFSCTNECKRIFESVTHHFFSFFRKICTYNIWFFLDKDKKINKRIQSFS